jgi:DNA adenine methylase
MSLQEKDSQLSYRPEFLHKRVKAKPFVKWAGGKRKLIASFAPHFPPMRQVKHYYEPFLGGGAVFFHLQHPHSFLSDGNQELVELYQVVRDDVEGLIKVLKRHRHEKAYYYQVRAQDRGTLEPVERAARFIFLNKICFNGLYRVNSKGQFNVPFGRHKNPRICDAAGLRAASLALQGVCVFTADFESAVSNAVGQDLIYFDPPYHPLSETSNFTSYTANRFDAHEQARLAQVCCDLDRRGCYVMLSNSDTPFIRKLYTDFHMIQVQANRAINSNASKRAKITELLIVNYSPGVTRVPTTNDQV